MVNYPDPGALDRCVFASTAFDAPKLIRTKYSEHELSDFWDEGGKCFKPPPYDTEDLSYTSVDDRRPDLQNTVVYGNTNLNRVVACATRVTSTMKLKSYPFSTLPLNEHVLMRDKYATFKHKLVVVGWVDSWDWIDIVNEWVDQFTALVEDHGLPHVKRLLREMAYELILLHGHVENSESWSAAFATLKIKLQEIAKYLKPPRGIFDLNGNPVYGNTVASSLVGLRWVERLKKEMVKPIYLDHEGRKGVVFFCPGVKFWDLHEVFHSLIFMEFRGVVYDYVGVYFSDDSCVSYRGPDGVIHMGNADISSCDASHSPDLFCFIEELLSGRGLTDGDTEMIQCLIAQLCLPIRVPFIKDVRGKKRISDYLEFKPKYPRLYSGSVLTTLVNNFASLSILVNFFYDCQVLDLATSASTIGYNVVFEEVSVPAGLQFLKHSPCWATVNGEQGYYPVLNLGPFVRMMWSSFGDVPGKSRVPLPVRFSNHMTGVLHGMYPRVYCPILPKLGTPILSEKIDPDAPIVHIDESSLLSRYGLLSIGQSLLDDELSPLSVEACRKILVIDYGFDP